jgi:hypothetical protein
MALGGWAGLWEIAGRFRRPTASDGGGVSGVSRLVLSIARVVVTKSQRSLGYTQRLRELRRCRDLFVAGDGPLTSAQALGFRPK